MKKLAQHTYMVLQHVVVHRPRVLGAILAGALALIIFVMVMEFVMQGGSHALDERLLLSLRDAGNPKSPIGPGWVEEAMRDITALGGITILGLTTLCGFFYLVMIRRYGHAAYMILASIIGTIISNWLKAGFDRPRPDLVPHGSITHTASFPSGHSLISAVVYLTLAFIITEVRPKDRLRHFFISCAAVIVLLIGVSRVYLGVHWPSDVLAGWLIGFAIAVIFWAFSRFTFVR